MKMILLPYLNHSHYQNHNSILDVLRMHKWLECFWKHIHEKWTGCEQNESPFKWFFNEKSGKGVIRVRGRTHTNFCVCISMRRENVWCFCAFWCEQACVGNGIFCTLASRVCVCMLGVFVNWGPSRASTCVLRQHQRHSEICEQERGHRRSHLPPTGSVPLTFRLTFIHIWNG